MNKVLFRITQLYPSCSGRSQDRVKVGQVEDSNTFITLTMLFDE